MPEKQDDVATTLLLLARGLLDGSLVCVYVSSESANEMGVGNGGRLRFEIIVKETGAAPQQEAPEEVEAPAGTRH